MIVTDDTQTDEQTNKLDQVIGVQRCGDVGWVDVWGGGMERKVNQTIVLVMHINRNIQVHIISHDNGPHTPTGT